MKQSPRCAPSTPGRTARGVAATCPAWDRVTAGANPAALTNFKLLLWPNTCNQFWTTALRRRVHQIVNRKSKIINGFASVPQQLQDEFRKLVIVGASPTRGPTSW